MKKGNPLHPKKVLLVSKTTRYESELEKSGATDEELRGILAARGSDYDRLRVRYDIHRAAVEHITQALDAQSIEYAFIKSDDYEKRHTCDADIVFSLGGDGTFLTTAAHIYDNTPILGINTDPKRSEGFLLNTTADNFTHDLERIIAGEYSVRHHSRIKVTLSDGNKTETLDHYALNEVFIAEHDSGNTTYYELSGGDMPKEKQKSSGIIVTTGNGSTAWYFNAMKVYEEDVRDILERAGVEVDDMLVSRITHEKNQANCFDAESKELRYVVREPVNNGVFHVEQQRGSAQQVTIHSRSWNASLKMDGKYAYPFNDGKRATLEIDPRYALSSIVFE